MNLFYINKIKTNYLNFDFKIFRFKNWTPIMFVIIKLKCQLLSVCHTFSPVKHNLRHFIKTLNLIPRSLHIFFISAVMYDCLNSFIFSTHSLQACKSLGRCVIFISPMSICFGINHKNSKSLFTKSSKLVILSCKQQQCTGESYIILIFHLEGKGDIRFIIYLVKIFKLSLIFFNVKLEKKVHLR